MIKGKKLLASLIAMIILSGCLSSTVFAAEITTTEDTVNSNQQLEEGYFIDEQGQVYYDPSSIEKESAVKDTDVKDADIAADTEKTDKVITDVKKSTKVKNTSAVKTKKANLVKVKAPSYSDAELRLLACLIYSEAGNQSYEAMLGVANVVLNRVNSDIFWHTKSIKAVIYDRKWSVQFSVTIKNKRTGLSAMDRALKHYDTGKYNSANPSAEKKAMEKAIRAAKAALEGDNNIGKYLCFTNKSCAGYVKKHYSKYEIMDDTIFYRTK